MATLSPEFALRLPWPLPALGAWGIAWLSFWLAALAGLPAPLALLLALWMPMWLAWRSPSLLRRTLLLAGFPVAMLLQGQVELPAWLWLLPLTLLLLMYPVRAWRDAPLFPTAAAALQGLASRLAGQDASLPASPKILDAGCGLGHGLRALRSEWPQAQLHGVEHSLVLALAARLWRRDARVGAGDMWALSWAGFDVVYIFQRPESMSRAWDKACRQMRPGSWLVSLEFEVPGRVPDLQLRNADQRPVLAWQLPAAQAGAQAQCAAAKADMSAMACPRAVP